jgi:hypothetical protein
VSNVVGRIVDKELKYMITGFEFAIFMLMVEA